MTRGGLSRALGLHCITDGLGWAGLGLSCSFSEAFYYHFIRACAVFSPSHSTGSSWDVAFLLQVFLGDPDEMVSPEIPLATSVAGTTYSPMLTLLGPMGLVFFPSQPVAHLSQSKGFL